MNDHQKKACSKLTTSKENSSSIVDSTPVNGTHNDNHEEASQNKRKKDSMFDCKVYTDSNESIKSSSNFQNNKRIKHTKNTEITTIQKEAEQLTQKLRHAEPVLQLNLPQPPSKQASSSVMNNSVPKISLPDSSSSLLATLMYPLPSSTFLSSCFRRKAVHIQSNDKNRADDISNNYMFGLDTKRIFEETSSDSVFLWIKPFHDDDKNDNSNYTTMEGLKSIELQDPETAFLLHKSSKHASYCRAPPELEQPLVYNMLRDTGLGCGQYDPTDEKLTTLGRGEVETFIGVEGHTTDWHTDFQENFTIQLSGIKKWTLRQGSLKHPLRGITPHYQISSDVIENQLKAARLSNPNFQFGKQDIETNAFGDEVEILMHAGDVLYFPAGMWHKVETIEYGVSINTSLMGVNYATLVSKAIEHLLLKKDEWREVVCKYNTDDASITTTTKSDDVPIQKLESLLSELPGIIEQFRVNGGANFILPPVLRQPAEYSLATSSSDSDNARPSATEKNEHNLEVPTDGMSHEEQQDEEEQDEEIDDESERDESKLSEHEHDHSSEMDDTSSVNDLSNNTENIVNVASFQNNGDCENDYQRPSPDHILIINPLATLMKIEDVTSFYAKGNKGTEDMNMDERESCDDLYILNVIYAGNESHESSVRTVFYDDSGVLESLYKYALQVRGDDESAALEDVCRSPPDALFHYGYLSWRLK